MNRLRAVIAGLRASLRNKAGAAQGQGAQSLTAGSPAANTVQPPNAYAIDPGGSPGWLRVLTHEQLLQSVRADKAIHEIWRQSRLSATVWERDCLPALRRYAEFVQLLPASEAHHHAHAGGLLSHTIEMLLAAMTWRNGHLLPAGVPIEVIDAQRDEWTYVVFFGALLHDIAKPMTDLRILWRARTMAEPTRWMPLAGSLPQVTQGRAGPEYLVEFAPKSARDYGAHSRLAMMLLPGIAPASAMTFMARQPTAFEALNQYLTGQDKDSLLAQIIRKADRASTERALLSGSKARFGTATAVPLVDLLMQAIGAMLRGGTTLPLNRSGAAGWVYEGSVWFVAKRLADAVRAWIKAHAPDESVPGETKNDRLFDTWQEYGCIQRNPVTGQAVWYVTVHGQGSEGGEATDEEGQAPEQGAYEHSLTMLRFPLAKLYADAARYPADMRGRIEVHARRKPGVAGEDAADGAPPLDGPDAPDVPAGAAVANNTAPAVRDPNPSPAQAPKRSGKAQGAKPKAEWAVREPAFNKPKAHAPAAPPQAPTEPPINPDALAPGATRPHEEGAPWLDADDDVAAATAKRGTRSGMKWVDLSPSPATATAPAPAGSSGAAAPGSDGRSGTPQSALSVAMMIAPLLSPQSRRNRPQNAEAGAPALDRSLGTGPVVLSPNLPTLPKGGAAAVEASPRAIEFMQWLQASLASRKLKYNETGAAVHFTAEGMALVSPIIFKTYARELGHEDDADERGLQFQREVIKAGWHMMGPNKTNIISYEVVGRGGATRSRLAAVVLVDPDRWVVPVPPSNPVLKML